MSNERTQPDQWTEDELRKRAAMGKEMFMNQVAHPAGGVDAEEITLGNVEDAFRNWPWGTRQVEAGGQVVEALVTAAKAILRNVPRSPVRTRALNAIVDARMLANLAITHAGRF